MPGKGKSNDSDGHFLATKTPNYSSSRYPSSGSAQTQVEAQRSVQRSDFRGIEESEPSLQAREGHRAHCSLQP
jgi:hypothetical protein